MATSSRSLMVLPELKGWMTFPEAAVKLGLSVERVRQMATAEPPQLKTAMRLGGRPVGIVRVAEVDEMAELRRIARENLNREPTFEELTAQAAGPSTSALREAEGGAGW